MAKLQRDDAKTLWEQMGENRSWDALRKTLEQHLEKSQGIEDCTVKALLIELKEMKSSKNAFPESAGKLAEMLNENIEQYRQQAGCSGKAAGQKKSQKQAAVSKREHEATSEHRQKSRKENKPEHRTAQSKQPLQSKERPAGTNSPYHPDQIATLYKRGNWKSWDQILEWLETTGRTDSEFEDAAVDRMIEDVQSLIDAGVPFIPEHEQAFTLVRKGK